MGVPSRPDGSTTVMPRVMPGASATSTEARTRSGDDAGFDDDGGGQGIDEAKIGRPGHCRRCRLARMCWPGRARRPCSRCRRRPRTSGRCRRPARQCVDAGLPRNDHRVDVGGEHDGRRFGVGEDVELGSRRDVAATIDRAAHDGEPADAADDAGRALQHQRQVGQRTDHQEIDRIAGRRRFEAWRRGSPPRRNWRSRQCWQGAARRPAHPRHGHGGVDDVLRERRAAAPLCTAIVDAGDGKRRQHVAGGRVEARHCRTRW